MSKRKKRRRKESPATSPPEAPVKATPEAPAKTPPRKKVFVLPFDPSTRTGVSCDTPLDRDPALEMRVKGPLNPTEHAADSHSPATHTERWVLVWEFATHIVVGTWLFMLILAVAVGLDLLIAQVREWKVTEFLVVLLSVTKYALAVGDVLLYVIFMSKESYLFVRLLLWGRS